MNDEIIIEWNCGHLKISSQCLFHIRNRILPEKTILEECVRHCVHSSVMTFMRNAQRMLIIEEYWPIFYLLNLCSQPHKISFGGDSAVRYFYFFDATIFQF
uniref:Dynamin-type G domain-containing protein n=1 Tax=Parascaris univalens TaxID=6257 RepID=A0A915C3I1_PARUN